VTTVPPEVRADLLRAAQSTRGADARGLPDALYTHWFTRAGDATPAPLQPDPSLIARLRAAHAASAVFEDGWVATARPGDIVAVRGPEVVALEPLRHVNVSRPAAPIRPGDALAVCALRDVVDTESGWWLTTGTAGAALASPMVRIYWNGGAEIAAALVRRLTAALEEAAEPFTFKCPYAPQLFARTDAIVVYLEPDTWSRVKDALRAVHQAVSAGLREPVPPLTRRLGRGVAVAEDPGDGQSFGQSRSAAVAAGLATLPQEHLADDDAVVEALAASLAAHDISPIRPHLSRSSEAQAEDAWSW
jgi:hypothetical protein